MKKLILSAVAATVCAGLFGLAVSAQGQNGSSNSGSQNGPHKIGLIDVGEVFQKYKKFENLRESLKSEIEERDRKVKEMAAQAQALQKQLNEAPYKEGSPEYKNLENQLIQLKTQYEAFKAQAQRDFLRKESQIYKTVYLEVADAVKKYAVYVNPQKGFYGYTLVLRFNRKALEEADDPRGILQSMNKQVVYYRENDDITDSVIDYLNRLYERQNGGAPKAAGAGGGTRRN